jgi:phosphoribosyl 1,2-cyclic phosphate phosphodiesterase
LELLFLGTGTSHGVPMIACECDVCRSSDPRDQRGRASVMLSWGGKNVAIDTGAEFRRQMLDHRVMRMDAVFYTHHHADHVHGIDDIRGFTTRNDGPMPVYAASETCDFFRRRFRYIFGDPSVPNIPRLNLREIHAPFELFGKTVTPVPILHAEQTIFGYRVDDLAYLTDCSGLPGSSWPLLADLDLLVVGALRPKPHPKHFSLPQALEFIERLKPRRALLTHISHNLGHEATSRTLPEGVEVAYDGLKVQLA